VKQASAVGVVVEVYSLGSSRRDTGRSRAQRVRRGNIWFSTTPAAASASVAQTSVAPQSSVAKPATSGSLAPSSAGNAAASSPPLTAPGATLKIAYSQAGAHFAPIWMAQDEGLFKKYGADSEIIRLSPPTNTQALLSGEVQVEVDGSSGVAAIAGGAPLVYIACPLPYCRACARWASDNDCSTELTGLFGRGYPMWWQRLY
jgi:hypothetical protein